MISEPKRSFAELVNAGQIELLAESFYENYYAAVMNESLCKNLIPHSNLKVLYTPLHGTGLKPVTSIFTRLGVDFDLGESQTSPNGDFPTCPYPNPETEPAFYEAQKVIAQAPGT